MIQLSIIDAIEAMEAGIQKAVDNADARHSGWSDKAYELLNIFIQEKNEPFRCSAQG